MTFLAIVILGIQQQALTDDQCIKCHEDQALDVKETMHQRAGVGCVSCHGTDEIVKEKHKFTPAFRPARVHQVAAVCGSCHAGALEAYRGSAHFELPKEDVIDPKHRSVCSACHEYHTTPLARRSTILKKCLECHEEGSFEYKGGAEACKSMDDLDEIWTRFNSRLREARSAPGIRILDLEEAKEEIGAARTRCRIAQHGLDWKPVMKDAASAADRTTAAYNTLAAREESFARRFLGLGLFLGLLGLSAAIIAHRARRLQGAA